MMVRGKIRLALTALIVLAVCTCLAVATVSAATGSTGGKSAGFGGKGMGVGFNNFGATTAIGKTGISATPFGTSGFSNTFAATDGLSAFGNSAFLTNNVVGARISSNTGIPAFNCFGTGFNNGFNTFGTGFNNFGASAFGTSNVAAGPTGTFLFSNAPVSVFGGPNANSFSTVSSTNQGVTLASDSFSTSI